MAHTLTQVLPIYQMSSLLHFKHNLCINLKYIPNYTNSTLGCQTTTTKTTTAKETTTTTSVKTETSTSAKGKRYRSHDC